MVLSLLAGGGGRSKSLSLGSGGHISDARVKRSAAIAFGHFRQRDHLDPGGVAGRTELLETFAAEIAHGVHRGFEEFARIEFASGLRRDFPECRRHRQPAIGVDIDLANAVPDATDDFLDRYAPGLRHLAA